MKLELRFFASIREALGTTQECVDVPASVRTIADLRAFLVQRGGVWSQTLGDGKVLRCALNQCMVDSNVVIEDGAEIAFFPPVTGG